MLSALSGIMLSGIVLNIAMLSVIILIVVMLTVFAPPKILPIKFLFQRKHFFRPWQEVEPIISFQFQQIFSRRRWRLGKIS